MTASDFNHSSYSSSRIFACLVLCNAILPQNGSARAKLFCARRYRPEGRGAPGLPPPAPAVGSASP